LAAEPPPGTSLERRPESLPDLKVPHRAGSIVAAFVSSIVEEAQARAAEIVAAAEEEAAARRQEALDGRAPARERMDFLATELPRLLSDLHREANSLSAAIGVDPPYAPAEPELGQSFDPDAVADLPADVEVHDPTVDEERDGGDAEPQPVAVVDAVVATEDPETEAAEAQASRITRMTDEELARTYVNAVNAAGREQDSTGATLLRSVAEGALEEALRRPAFADRPPATRRRRRGGFLRRRPRRDESFDQLRQACQRAQAEPLAVEASAS
jgi:hypothetical protein